MTHPDERGTNPAAQRAAAEAASFSMALAAGREKAGHAPTRVETKAACTVEKVGDGSEITSIRLRTTVTAPGIDAATFQEKAEAAKKGGPVSRALSPSIEVVLDAQLA